PARDGARRVADEALRAEAFDHEGAIRVGLLPDVCALAAARADFRKTEARERTGGGLGRALRGHLGGIERAVVDPALGIRKMRGLRLVAHPSRFARACRCRSISAGR